MTPMTPTTPVCTCGHYRTEHTPMGICVNLHCECRRFNEVEEPPEDEFTEGVLPEGAKVAMVTSVPVQICMNCGHTLYQHSTGECDIHRCACKGFVASITVDMGPIRHHPPDTVETIVIMVGVAIASMGFGVWIGWLRWGLTW